LKPRPDEAPRPEPPQLAKVDVEPDQDGRMPTATSTLRDKAASIGLFGMTFAIVASAFMDSVRLTHRAKRLRRRAMVPFVVFLLSTSLIPLAFTLTQASSGLPPDPAAITAYFSLMIVSKASIALLRCVLRPVLRVDYDGQDAMEHCIAATYCAGCLVIIAAGWLFHGLGLTPGIAWYGLPIVGLATRVAPSLMACAQRRDHREMRLLEKQSRHWPDDRARLAAFTDGVLAISATFTLLEIRAPVVPIDDDGGAVATPLMAYLAAHWRDLASYAAAFSVILQLWATHREVTESLPRFGHCLRNLNLAACCVAALVPFGMSLVVNFPDDGAACAFALGVVMTASLVMALIPAAGRWCVRDGDGLPALFMVLGHASDGGDGSGSDDEGDAAGRAGGWATPGGPAGSPADRSELRRGDDSYYGFLVEDDPGMDGKTDGRVVASAAMKLRPMATAREEDEEDEEDEETMAAARGYVDDGVEHPSTPSEEGGEGEDGTEPEEGDPERTWSPARARPGLRPSRAFGAGEASQPSPRSAAAAPDVGAAALDAALLVRSGAGAYEASDLPASLEEHLLRLVVARALVLPLLAAVAIPVAFFVPAVGMLVVLLSWPVVGLVGCGDHGLRRPTSRPSAFARVLLCWTGVPRAIPGVGAVYAMHQGPCCCFFACRRVRAVCCCDQSADMDDFRSAVARYSVEAARRAIRSAHKLDDDDRGTAFVAETSRTSLNGGRSTELVSRRV